MIRFCEVCHELEFDCHCEDPVCSRCGNFEFNCLCYDEWFYDVYDSYLLEYEEMMEDEDEKKGL